MATLTALTATTVLAAGDQLYVVDGANSRKIAWSAVLDQLEAQGAAPASFIASGTFADARVAESNVTQHEAALSVTESQISDLGTYQVELAEGQFADGDKTKLDGIEASADVTDEANVTDALDGATLTDLGTPASGDLILLQDASDSNILKVAQFSTFGGAGAGDAWGDAVDADIVPDADGTRDIGANATRFAQGYFDQVYSTQGLIITEAADHPITPAAGQAQLWIENTATQTLQVTFDDGTDAEVLTGASGATLASATSAGADSLPFFDDSDSDNPKQTTITDFISDNSIGLTSGNLSQFAATTSAQLAGVLSDETGSGAAVFGTSPTLGTPTITDPLIEHTYNAQTGTSYELVDADQSAVITMNNASANTLTIPPNAEHAFPVGTKIEVWQLGAGTTTIAGDTGVTLQGNGGSASAGSCDIQTQYGGATLTKIATDTWMVGGDIDAVA